MSSATVDGVLALADRGWRLLPVEPHGKRPLLPAWPTRASCDARQVRSWSEAYPDANWAVACGRESGVWTLDVDGERGENSLRELSDRHGRGWLDTLSVITPRGGHFYYRYTGTVPTSAGRLAPGLDVRGDGGYVVVPPSVHPSGIPYRWRTPNTLPATPPNWLLQKVAYSRIKLAPEGVLIGEGNRNNWLTRQAGALRRKGADRIAIEKALVELNMRACCPPLSDGEIASIAESVSRYAIGGPDALERAWRAVTALPSKSLYGQFLLLCERLQADLSGQPIALPLQRIGGLFNCDWTQARRWRKRAVRDSLLIPVGEYTPHRKAATYRFTSTVGSSSLPLRGSGKCPTKSVPLLNTNTDLVGHLGSTDQEQD